MSADSRHDPTASRAQEALPSTVDHVPLSSPEVEPPVFVANANDGAAPLGHFRYAVSQRKRQQVLANWCVSSNDPSLLDRVAQLLGGTLQRHEEGAWSVITNALEVDIMLMGPHAIRLGWSRASRRTCDGHFQREHGSERPCACPPSLPERKVATRHGHGCAPEVDVVFRLCQDPLLGPFQFTSGSWPFAEDAMRALEVLSTYREPGRARLHLQRAPYKLTSGQVLSRTTPTMSLLTRVKLPHRAGRP